MLERKKISYSERVFNAKLLLFGEYTVLSGSSSLAIPFPKYTFSLQMGLENSLKSIIDDLYLYLIEQDFTSLKCTFNSSAYKEAFDKGLYFSSEIPIGFGLGSSGAFTAALFESFFTYPKDLLPIELKKVLALIESFFHGKSSGIDPLIIYLNKGIHTDQIGNINLYKIDASLYQDLKLYLINSGKKRTTAEYVHIFKEKCKDEEYIHQYIQPLSKLNDQIIDLFLKRKNKCDNLYDLYQSISSIQWKAFREMIIYPIDQAWKYCLENNKHSMKLCGAGGGGFYFLLSKDVSDFKNQFPNLEVIDIF